MVSLPTQLPPPPLLKKGRLVANHLVALSTQVPPLLHNRLRARHRLHLADAVADLPTAAAPGHRHDRRLHAVCAVGGRADRRVGGAVGPRRRVERVQCGSVYPEPHGPDAADAGVAAAAERVPELAGCVCTGAGGEYLFAVDYGYGVSGFCL